MKDVRKSVHNMEEKNFWNISENDGKKFDVQTMLTKTNV